MRRSVLRIGRRWIRATILSSGDVVKVRVDRSDQQIYEVRSSFRKNEWMYKR